MSDVLMKSLIEIGTVLSKLDHDFHLLSKNAIPEVDFKTEKLQKMKSETQSFDCILDEFVNICHDNWKNSEAIYLNLLNTGTYYSYDEEYYLSSWITIASRSLYANTKVDMLKHKYSFDEETENFYGTIVQKEYFEEVDETKKAIESLISEEFTDDKPLYLKLKQFNELFIIPDNNYQKVFEETFLITTNKYYNTAFEFNEKKDLAVFKYFNDINDSAEAYAFYIGNNVSDILCNTARPISIIKSQQLTAHEGTHHYHFCMLETFYQKYPFLKSDIELHPLSFIIEAAAEVAVDLIFKEDFRIVHLEQLLKLAELPQTLATKLEKLLKVDTNLTKMWRAYTLTAKRFLNGELSEEECIKEMEEQNFRLNNSWPNCEFFKKFRSYISSYGWGKHLIMSYLKNQEGDVWESFLNFLRYPLSPTELTIVYNRNSQK